MTTMTRQLVLAAGLLVAMALAGCSTSVAGQPSAAAPAASVSVSAAPAAVSTPAAAPEGNGTPTPTGTRLPVGQAATVAYPVDRAQTGITTLEVTVTSVQQGTIDDLADFELDAQTKLGDPSYVTVSLRNTGTAAMDPGGIFGLINAVNAAGDELAGLSLFGDFPVCEGLPPESLAPGASFSECDVYIAPKGQPTSAVIFAFYLALDRTEITWTT